MKPRHLLLPLFFLLHTSAQLEIDLIEVEDPSVEMEAGHAPKAVGHGQPVERRGETLRFLNGNELTGRLQEITAEGIVWVHPDASEPITFAPGNVKEIELKTDADAEAELMALSRIELTNGDTLRGTVIGLQQDSLKLSSPATGDITLQARMVKAILPNPVSSRLVDGPINEEDWEFQNLGGGNSSWEVREGTLVAADRNLVAALDPKKLPDRYTISMDWEWKGRLNVQFAFWAGNTRNPNSNAYTINLQNNYLRAYRNYDNVGGNNFVNQQIQQELNLGYTTLTLHLDKTSKQMVLLLDGNMIGQWQDVFDGEILGDKILLYTQDTSPVRVSNFRIQEWDGELRAGEDSKKSDQDRVTTTNGDEFVGSVMGIAEGVLSFKNEFAEFKVPLDRVGELQFGADSRATPRLMAGDVTLRTSAGEVLTLKLEEVKNGVLSGSSENMGSLAVQLRYFSEITFNPYDERHDQDESIW